MIKYRKKTLGQVVNSQLRQFACTNEMRN